MSEENLDKQILEGIQESNSDEDSVYTNNFLESDTIGEYPTPEDDYSASRTVVKKVIYERKRQQ